MLEYHDNSFTKPFTSSNLVVLILNDENEKNKVKELIHSGTEIDAMKKAFGRDLTLKIYISPGGEPHTTWDDRAQKEVKTKTKRPADWQYDVMRKVFSRFNNEFAIKVKIVKHEKIPILKSR